MSDSKHTEFYGDTQTCLKCRTEAAVKPETDTANRLSGMVFSHWKDHKLLFHTPLKTNNNDISKIKCGGAKINSPTHYLQRKDANCDSCKENCSSFIKKKNKKQTTEFDNEERSTLHCKI